jgi:hypothetical protein
MIKYNFDTDHIGFISLQVDLIQIFLDFLQKTTGLTRSVSIRWIREPALVSGALVKKPPSVSKHFD